MKPAMIGDVGWVSLDRHATFIVAAYLAGAARWMKYSPSGTGHHVGRSATR